MRAGPFVVAAAVVMLLALRIRRTRRSGAATDRGARRIARRVPLGDMGLVAFREVRERVRGRFFRVITLVLLAVVAAAIVIPTLRGGSAASLRVGVVGPLPSALRHDALRAAARTGVSVRLVDEADLRAARAALSANRVAAVIDAQHRLIVRTPVSATARTGDVLAVRAIATSLGIDGALRAAKLSPAQAAILAHAGPLPVTSLQHRSGTNGNRSTSLIGIVLVFVMLTQYLTWTLMGVMEEKSSRVVEVLLATVRPVQLLGGKVLGIGLVAMAQAAVVVAFALVLAKAVGSDVLHGTTPVVIVATLAWLVLGYAFYSWVYAAAGSMVERQDQMQSLALPLSVPIIFGYVVSLVSASGGHPSLFVKVLAFLPPTAPFAMPVLVATGATTWWGFASSVAISVLCTVGVARLAAGVYRRAVLRTGRQVRLRELLASTSR